jgi:hypothetical protein
MTKTETKLKHAKNGYNVECTHSGQYRPYGDTYRVFIVKSDKPESEVEKYCTEHVRECKLSREEYLKDEREGVKDFGDHFRSSYSFRKVKDGEYFYKITEPSTH